MTLHCKYMHTTPDLCSQVEMPFQNSSNTKLVTVVVGKDKEVHLLEDSSVFLHLVKLVLLVWQGLAPVGKVHVPEGQGGLLVLLALPLLGLHPLQASQPPCKLLQFGMPLPHLPGSCNAKGEFGGMVEHVNAQWIAEVRIVNITVGRGEWLSKCW